MFDKKIWIEKDFQTSINIAYDINNDSKLKGFIPTASAIEIIEDVMLSTSISDKERARILIGAYGRGKSHIVLTLMSLLYKKDLSLFEPILNRIKEQKPDLHNYIVDYIKSDKKLFPIIISGSSTSITQSFLSSLQISLNNSDLMDLMPDTNFKAAVNTIKLWENNYIDTYNKFTSELNLPIEEFILLLNEYNVNAYERFYELYPTLTSGSDFNPFIGFDVVELYESVVDKLIDKGYSGIYIIYDEFSKYLESSIANATISDIKLLQDFAEKCDRSGNKQMHLMLISHKDISNYIDKSLPKDKVDGWSGVSGRFKHIHIHNNFTQMYEIIAAVIKKDIVFWNDYCEKHENRIIDLTNRFYSNGLFSENDIDSLQDIITGCYPLHPVSTFILPRLSEKVAQNERTLFTFLSSNNNYTLTAFLENSTGNFPLLTPDILYDYFEQLLRKEPYTSPVHEIYITTSKVLQKIDEKSLASKIIKTISLIYIIEQFEKLPPTKNTIIETFIDSVGNINDIYNVLEELIENEYIIYLKRSTGYLKIKESSGVDINNEIRNAIDKARQTTNIKDIINNASFDNYMYPTAYNDNMEITRYFDFRFIDSEEFFAVADWNKKIESLSSDGVMFAIIPKSDMEIEQIKQTIIDGKSNHNRVIFVLPIEFFDIENIALEYKAVEILKEAASDDYILYEEYDIIYDDLEEVITKYITSYTRPETGRCEYYWLGEKQPFKRKAQLSSKLSDICYDTYPNTPIINNESINKNELPTVAINNRSRLISGLLENELSVNLGLTGAGQDVSFMRSTLKMTGILSNEQIKPILSLNPEDVNMRKTLSVIQDFFVKSNENKEQNFKDLYDKLTLPEFGYGLKKGVIPIYIAVVLHFFKKHLVIKYKNEEVKITADLLNSINENPKTYTAYLEDWSDDKTTYIESLTDIFSDYIITRERDYNTFTYVVSAMVRWYLSLPKYSKELRKVYKGLNAIPEDVSSEHTKLLGSLKKPNINARDFLFEKIFNIYGYKEFTLDIVDKIRKTKSLFDNAKEDLISHLLNDVREIFKSDQTDNATLPSIIKDFIEGLKPTTLNYLFPNDEHRVLKLMNSICNDENKFIYKLTKLITGLRVDDWNEDTITEFTETLKEVKKTVLEYDATLTNNDKTKVSTNSYTVCFIDNSGNEVVKKFNKVSYSARGKLLYNEILTALEDMGRSITEQEKRQILMEFIEKLCGKEESSHE